MPIPDYTTFVRDRDSVYLGFFEDVKTMVYSLETVTHNLGIILQHLGKVEGGARKDWKEKRETQLKEFQQSWKRRLEHLGDFKKFKTLTESLELGYSLFQSVDSSTLERDPKRYNAHELLAALKVLRSEVEGHSHPSRLYYINNYVDSAEHDLYSAKNLWDALPLKKGIEVESTPEGPALFTLRATYPREVSKWDTLQTPETCGLGVDDSLNCSIYPAEPTSTERTTASVVRDNFTSPAISALRGETARSIVFIRADGSRFGYSTVDDKTELSRYIPSTQLL